MSKIVVHYKKLSKVKKIAIISICIFLVVLSIFIYNTYKALNSDNFYRGIYIEGVDISDLSIAEAKKVLYGKFINKFENSSISLVYNDKTWPLALNEIDYCFNIDTTLKSAYKLGRSGKWYERSKQINLLKISPVNFEMTVSYNESKLTDKLVHIKKQIDCDAKSSSYSYNYGKINYTDDIYGRSFDLVANNLIISSHLDTRNLSSITLVVNDIKPRLTVSEVKDIKDLLATFTTSFNAYDESRTHNVKLACQKINNIIVKPGEQFSMNTALGPRTEANGYRNAPVILNNELTPGTGGGVCQVTSTLYNAILLSRLNVVQRSNHSIPLGYVPPGQDATISEGYLDLKFKNNRDYPVCIVAFVKNSNLTIQIIGKKRADDLKTQLKPVILETYEAPEPDYIIDDSLADYQQIVRKNARNGMKVVLYRQTLDENGNVIKTEKISTDVYMPLKGKVAVNHRTYNMLKNST